MHIIKENSDATPIPRSGLHLSYIKELDYQTGMRQGNRKKYDPMAFQKLFVKAAADNLKVTLCEAFPEGELPGCADAAPLRNELAKNIWRYIERWPAWSQIYRHKHPNATVLLDSYREELACLHRQIGAACSSGGPPWSPSQASACIRRDSNLSVK